MAREVFCTRDFAKAAADFIVTRAREALGARDEFRIALSGGNTPRPVYAELSRRDLPWEKILVTFGDERCVPPEDDQSNYRMANETLLRPASVPAKSVLRMRGEIDPLRAADEYQLQLDTFGARSGEKIYRHDLILLGLGEDGHTASLFPGTAALNELNRRVVANDVPSLKSRRLTFTFPLILAARSICFLVDASKRAKIIEKIFSGDESLPATLVDRDAESVTWVIREYP